VGLRRGRLKIHLFELVILANVAALHALLHAEGLGIRFVALRHTVAVAAQALLPLFFAGWLFRLAYSAATGRLRQYLRRTFTWSWLFLTLRLLLSTTLVIHVYGWLKGLLRLLRPRLYDQLLWDVDRWTFFGLSPNVFSLHALGEPAVLRTIDAGYGAVFFATMAASIPFFLPLASDRLRVAWATGYSLLWLAGAWLYYLLPALGPCYAFPEVWQPFAEHLPKAAASQAFLFRNYQLVPLIEQGVIHPDFNLMAGIAAFPSLHVASQAFLALWARRLLPRLRLVFDLSVVLIFVGSVVTGWHYLVDSVAGAVLGWACFRFGYALYGLRRWS
jgi:hypothetical protein